jgi:hypothetical protein
MIRQTAKFNINQLLFALLYNILIAICSVIRNLFCFPSDMINQNLQPTATLPSQRGTET